MPVGYAIHTQTYTYIPYSTQRGGGEREGERFSFQSMCTCSVVCHNFSISDIRGSFFAAKPQFACIENILHCNVGEK